MKHLKLLIILIIFIFSSCNIEKKDKELVENYLSHYSTVKETKFDGNIIGYSFYNSKEDDSIEWEIPNVPAIHFAMNGKNIYRVYIRNYRGKMPDSLDLSNLRILTLENSILEGNKDIFTNTKISTIEMYNSFFYDSVVNLKIFPNLNHTEIVNSRTNFVINDSLPIKQLGYAEYDSLYPPKEIHIEFDKLPNLKTVLFKCRNCKIDIPHDSLNLIYKEDENGIEITKGSYPIIPQLDNKK